MAPTGGAAAGEGGPVYDRDLADYRPARGCGTIDLEVSDMGQSLRLGRIAGIPVGVHWSVLVIMVLLVYGLAVEILPANAPGQRWPVYWGIGIAGALLFLSSLLAHEIAHAVVARRFGVRVERVTLWLLGGVAEFADEPPTARADLVVAGVGPLTSLVVGAGFGAVTVAAVALDLPAAVSAVLAWLAIINVVLAVFNLLPGAPLDGGRVLRALLWAWRGDRYRAAMAAARAGHTLGLVLVFVGVAQALVTGVVSGLWLALVGWFLISAANAEQAATRFRTLLNRVPVRSVMSPNPVTGDPDQSVEEFVRTVAAGTRHRAFPLRDAAGVPHGVVRLADLARVPAARRGATPLGQVATPLARVPVVNGSQLLADVTPVLARGGLALVVDNGRLVGVLNAEDVAHATELAELSSPPDA